jgi:hypothetical protein
MTWPCLVKIVILILPPSSRRKHPPIQAPGLLNPITFLLVCILLLILGTIQDWEVEASDFQISLRIRLNSLCYETQLYIQSQCQEHWITQRSTHGQTRFASYWFSGCTRIYYFTSQFRRNFYPPGYRIWKYCCLWAQPNQANSKSFQDHIHSDSCVAAFVFSSDLVEEPAPKSALLNCCLRVRKLGPVAPSF